ncbi:hypothetical protein FQ085_06635 [Planococcus sp. ANT_H30]|uniref:hypothetical protein n=1 Tax=Planococcus TaxID=1372 RepID=UPI0011ED1512|nr:MULTISPECIES: hypothetical protein [Planococcus]KAA0957723.1 hypothetical protein FQ085_06635 [Planococcus sp. ANT_H30]MCH4825756.1 hypothetical protein [Planococcus halocryophilus]
MDYAGAYETLLNFRHLLVDENLENIKKDYIQFSSHEIGNSFYKLVEEGYIEIKKVNGRSPVILKVLK